jgi:hypothetical protein
VLVLSSPKEFGQLLSLALPHDVPILAFASLTPVGEVAAGLGVAFERVTDLEQSLSRYSEDDDTAPFPELSLQRQWESQLEPYVPFGLLVQKYFDSVLPDDEARAAIPPG